MLRYYVTATSDNGLVRREPVFIDDEASPEYYGTIIADPALDSRLPVLHWYVENSRRADTNSGTRASLFYDGEFYDNIFVRIRGGTARSYYVGIESAMPAVPGLEPPIQALCLAPFGMEEGTEADIPPQEFGLVVGEPVRFRFFGSSVRRDDEVGLLLEDWPADQLEELEEIQATLPAESRAPGEVVPVRLRASVTEVGTLRLEAIPRSGSEQWKVELNVRSAPGE